MFDIHEIISFFRGALGQFADRSAKWLLTNPVNLRGLLEIIGKDLVALFDFSRVPHVNTTFIADNLREQESDLVFLLPFRDTDETEVMIYILWRTCRLRADRLRASGDNPHAEHG